MNQRQFNVFGEPVTVVINTEETKGAFSVVTQISPPGGGPPPHSHANEDEIFTVLEGEFELFNGRTWHKLRTGETAFALRNSVHTFRNCGSTAGKIQAACVPGNGFETYLEAISVLEMPRDVEQLMSISERYGIRFIGPETPTEAPL